jgi:ATP-binding cassette subfamily C protein CydD
MPVESWLKSHRRLARPALSLAVGVGVLGGFLLVLQAHWLARIVDAVALRGAGPEAVAPWMWALLGVFAVRALLARAAEQLAVAAAARVKIGVRHILWDKLRALGPVPLYGERSGELANTLVDGVEALEAYYARYLPAMALMALVPLSILAFVLPADTWSALILLLTAPLIPLFMIFIGKGAEALNQRQWRRMARMSAHFLDTLQGLTTLKLFGASRREAQAVARVSDAYRRSTMGVLRVAFLSSLALEFFATVSVALVAVSIGFRLLAGEMDFQAGFFVLLLAPEFYLPLRSMGAHYHARMEAIGAAERMVELLEMPIPASGGEGAVPVRAGREAGQGGAAQVRLDEVHYAYAPGREALAGVSLEIESRRRVALVGPSGAGKSTVINLLLGFARPQQGAVWVADTRLDEIDVRQWCKHVAWVPQQPRLFHGTLRDNILLAKPDASPDELEEALRLARVDEFVGRFAAGIDTRIGDRGEGLSGGQAQRVALARAFLKDAPLVLLDEATAHLDAHNQALVQEAIDALAVGRSLLVVAHRLDTVRSADRIYVLDSGRVAEQGSHSELVAAGGLYSRLVAAYGGLP